MGLLQSVILQHTVCLSSLSLIKTAATELGASCTVQLPPSEFKAIPHVQQQSVRHVRNTRSMRREVLWCGLCALPTSGMHLCSWSALELKKQHLHCFGHLCESTVNSNAGGTRLAKTLLCYLFCKRALYKIRICFCRQFYEKSLFFFLSIWR